MLLTDLVTDLILVFREVSKYFQHILEALCGTIWLPSACSHLFCGN